MAEITSSLVKDMTRELGADLVGIASVDRFEGAPPGHHPAELLPGAKSVIVAAIRIPDPVVECDTYHLKMEDLAPDQAVQAIENNFYMQMGHYVLDVQLNTMSVKTETNVSRNAPAALYRCEKVSMLMKYSLIFRPGMI